MKKRTLYYILSFPIIIGLFFSCISSEETNYLQPIQQKYGFVDFEEYKLAVRDVVACKISTTDKETVELFDSVIFDDVGTETSLPLTIYEDSTVIFPFFGSLKIAGLTLQEAEVKLQDMMKESILDAQVKLTLLSNTFYIYANDRQGQYRVYKENMTIYQALAISGQTTDRMDLSKVKIVRKSEDGHDIVKVFDLRSQDVIQSEFYYIKPNDVIYFSTNKNAFFSITSVSSFISLIVTPLTYLYIVTQTNFK